MIETMRAFGIIVLAGVAALGLTYVAGWDETSAPARDESAVVVPGVAPEEIVRRAAAETRPVDTVFCQATADERVLCAVTFVGPSCQLWEIAEGEARALPLVVEGATGSRSGTGVRCS
jgi:hypothetical protein